MTAPAAGKSMTRLADNYRTHADNMQSKRGQSNIHDIMQPSREKVDYGPRKEIRYENQESVSSIGFVSCIDAFPSRHSLRESQGASDRNPR